MRVVVDKAALHCGDTLASEDLVLQVSGAILCSQMVFVNYARLIFILVLPLEGVILLALETVGGLWFLRI